MPGAAKVTGTVRSKNPLKGAVEILPVRSNTSLVTIVIDIDRSCFIPSLLLAFLLLLISFYQHIDFCHVCCNVLMTYYCYINRNDYTMRHYRNYPRVIIY